jgi:DNA polymerase-1
VTLLEHHRERLETTSAISAEVVAARGYASVETRDELRGRGFPRDIGRHLPALLIPVYGLRTLEPGELFEPSGLLLRPDLVYSFKDGRAAKYLAPASQANVLDAHPLAREWVLNADVPLVLVEGIVKADSAVSVGLAAIGLGGVDGGWRNGVPLPEWELVPLRARQTLVAFDSDVTIKQSVRSALDRLVGYLQRRGAEVEIVVLPPGENGRKTGLDDFLAAHRGSRHPIGLLLEHAVQAADIPEEGAAPAPSLPEGMTGADVLDRHAELLTQHIRFRIVEETWAVTLWTAATCFVLVFEIVAYLAISSATMRSGKSHLLDLIRWTCARGRRMSGGSDAAIFRTLAQTPPPTLVFDEVDNYIGESTERTFLIGVLNEGFERDGVVSRVEDVGGGVRDVVDYPVFGPKAFTGIGKLLPATTLDRSIPIRLERRLRSERVARWRARRVREQAAGVHELLAGWAAVATELVAEHYDSDLTFPVGTSERAEDVWESLLAVAAAAGGEWPERARKAALALTPSDDDSTDLAILLLAGIRHVFHNAKWPDVHKPEEHMFKSGELVNKLNALEEAPWGGLRDGRGLSTHRLARELAAFGLEPERHQLEKQQVRGWWRSSLEPVWKRYLPALEEDEMDPEEEGDDDGSEKVRKPESPVSAKQSVYVSGSADFPHEQAHSGADTLFSEDGSQNQSVCDEHACLSQKQANPDTQTLSNAKTAETGQRTHSGTVVEESFSTALEGLSQTIELGEGPPLEARLLPAGEASDAREDFNRFLAAAKERGAVLALDCETTGIDPYASGFAVRLWSVSDGRQAWAVDARDERTCALLTAVFDRWPHGLAVHNVAYDVPVACRTLPVDVAALTAGADRLADTMILARLCRPDEQRIGLKEMAKLEFGNAALAAEERLKLAFKHLRGRAETKWASVDPAHPAYWGYAAADAALTARLHERFRADVDDGMLRLEMRVALISLRAGLRGWAVDADQAAQLEQNLAGEQERLEQRLRRKGVAKNIATGPGRASIIAALEREGATLGGARLDREVLEPLAHAGSEIARDVLALRTVEKFRSLYARMVVGAAERDGRLHAFPRTLAAATGRMSLRDVPLQTMPKGELELTGENGTIVGAAVRGALVADDGLVCAGVDFETMELRLAAALSGDARLRAVVERGDAHTQVARFLFDTKTPTRKQRALAKTVNFGVLYGMGAAGLAKRLRIDEQEARAFVSRWWDRFPAVRHFRVRVAREERRSLWGRRLPQDGVPDHIALNHVIQGYGRDVFCAGLLALEDAGLDQHLLLPLHDEYVLALPANGADELAAEIAGRVRGRLGETELPVETRIGGRSWASVGGATA